MLTHFCGLLSCNFKGTLFQVHTRDLVLLLLLLRLVMMMLLQLLLPLLGSGWWFQNKDNFLDPFPSSIVVVVVVFVRRSRPRPRSKNQPGPVWCCAAVHITHYSNSVVTQLWLLASARFIVVVQVQEHQQQLSSSIRAVEFFFFPVR